VIQVQLPSCANPFRPLLPAQSFGPVMRFVHGTKHAAGMIASHLRSAAKMAVQAAPAASGGVALKTRS